MKYLFVKENHVDIDLQAHCFIEFESTKFINKKEKLDGKEIIFKGNNQGCNIINVYSYIEFDTTKIISKKSTRYFF